MSSIEIGWKKPSPGEVQFSSNRQLHEQQPNEKLKNQAKKSVKKTVHFNSPTPATSPPAFGNTGYNPSGTVRSYKSVFEDDDTTSSRADICPNE